MQASRRCSCHAAGAPLVELAAAPGAGHREWMCANSVFASGSSTMRPPCSSSSSSSSPALPDAARHSPASLATSALGGDDDDASLGPFSLAAGVIVAAAAFSNSLMRSTCRLAPGSQVLSLSASKPAQGHPHWPCLRSAHARARERPCSNTATLIHTLPLDVVPALSSSALRGEDALDDVLGDGGLDRRVHTGVHLDVAVLARSSCTEREKGQTISSHLTIAPAQAQQHRLPGREELGHARRGPQRRGDAWGVPSPL